MIAGLRNLAGLFVVLVTTLAATILSSGAAGETLYVAPAAVGRATGKGAGNAAGFRDDGLWKRVGERLASGPVTITRVLIRPAESTS